MRHINFLPNSTIPPKQILPFVVDLKILHSQLVFQRLQNLTLLITGSVEFLDPTLDQHQIFDPIAKSFLSLSLNSHEILTNGIFFNSFFQFWKAVVRMRSLLEFNSFELENYIVALEALKRMLICEGTTESS